MSAPLALGYLVPEWPGQTHAFFWREIQALRERGDHVALFSTRDPGADASAHAFAAQARAETTYLYPPGTAAAAYLFAHPVRTLRAIAFLARIEMSMLRRAGLLLCAARLAHATHRRGLTHLHAHSCADSALLVACAAQLADVGYSLTLHGDLPVYGTDHAAKMARATFVAVVTRPLRDQVMAETGRDAAHVPVIPMGVDTARFAPVDRPPRDRPLRLVTVARLNHTKGHRFALEGIARARRAGHDIEYTIAGDGPERAAIAAQVDLLGLRHCVTLTGNLGEEQVIALLARSDAFVLTSFGLGEAAPVSVMEAMACALPVVCSRIGGTADMIEDGVSGLLVDQQDVAGIANAILLLANDADRRAAIGAAARDRAVAEFDYRATARAFAAAIAAHARPDRENPPRKTTDGVRIAPPAGAAR